jgi:hypothetical protein
MGAATSFIGAGGPMPPPSSARRGIAYMEGVEIAHEMYVHVRKQMVQPDNSESPLSQPVLALLLFARVRATGSPVSHPLDPPVLALIPQAVEAASPPFTSPLLMPMSEKVVIFTSRTLRSVVYYRGELALELMPRPDKGPARKRFVLNIADEHVSKKAWKAYTRVMTMQFRAYWENLSASGVPHAKPGFGTPAPVVPVVAAEDAGEEVEAAENAAPTDAPHPSRAPSPCAPEPSSVLPAPATEESGDVAPADNNGTPVDPTAQLLVGGKTNYPKSMRPIAPNNSPDLRRSRPTGSDDSTVHSGMSSVRRGRGGSATTPSFRQNSPAWSPREYGARDYHQEPYQMADPYDRSPGMRSRDWQEGGQRWAQGPPDMHEDPAPPRYRSGGSPAMGRGGSSKLSLRGSPPSRPPFVPRGGPRHDGYDVRGGVYETMKSSETSPHPAAGAFLYQESVKTGESDGHPGAYPQMYYGMPQNGGGQFVATRDESGRPVFMQQMPMDAAYHLVSQNSQFMGTPGMQMVPVMVPMMMSAPYTSTLPIEAEKSLEGGDARWAYTDAAGSVPPAT